MNVNGHHWIRDKKRQAIYARDDYRCVYCGRWCGLAPGRATLDHVVPREDGGTNEARNLITSCRPCNNSKGRKRLSDWADLETQLRVSLQVLKPLRRPASPARPGKRKA